MLLLPEEEKERKVMTSRDATRRTRNNFFVVWFWLVREIEHRLRSAALKKVSHEEEEEVPSEKTIFRQGLVGSECHSRGRGVWGGAKIMTSKNTV